jgi:hypothetical protein
MVFAFFRISFSDHDPLTLALSPEEGGRGNRLPSGFSGDRNRLTGHLTL